MLKQKKDKENSVFDLIVVPWKSRVIFVAVRLKIFTILSKKELTVEELAKECEAVPYLLKALLDACVSMDLIEYQNDLYKNSQFSQEYLVEGESHYVGDLIQLQDDESIYWDKLGDLILGNRERRSEDARYRTFIKAMNNLGMLGEGEALKNFVDLSGKTQMIDAGGGSGLYSIILCQKYPELHSTILDRKDTLSITKEMISGYKESARITLKEGDIIENSFGENIDVILFSDVIYEEDTAITILKNAWNCLGADGILIVRGYYSDPENTRPLFGALFTLGQLVFDSKRKIMTISSLQKNVLDAGFTLIKMSPLTERSFALVAKKCSEFRGF